jgi:hypothetical protein
LWTAMESEIFDLGAIHADPNPANFAFRKDGSVIMYDFGCVKTLEPGVADGCASLVVAGLGEDYATLEQTLIGLGVRRSSGPSVPAEFYKLWRDWLALPILAADSFDFGTAKLEQDVFTKLLPPSLKYVTSFQPSRELVFLNRTLVGHYQTLRGIRARVPLGPLLAARIPELATWFGSQRPLPNTLTPS